jgi:hypothetical protein
MLILVVESAEIPEFRDISEDLLKHNIGVCANNAVAHQNMSTPCNLHLHKYEK